jgi:hypothetical protein
LKVHSKGESDVRQGTTERRSASITNLVLTEAQYLQLRVLAAYHTQIQLDNNHYQSKKMGLRA